MATDICGCDREMGRFCDAHRPAFPSGKIDAGSCWEDWPHLGLTARDYFAAHALIAIGINYGSDHFGKPTFDEEVRKAYECADAMLTQRTKQPQEAV